LDGTGTFLFFFGGMFNDQSQLAGTEQATLKKKGLKND
jgi:hypothetical protein